jgi:N-acetylmuramoyl-L-alanine amidase
MIDGEVSGVRGRNYLTREMLGMFTLWSGRMRNKQLGGSEKMKRICIDAGHGGKDPGAIGRSGLNEKDINMQVALKVADLLMDRYTVVMTRTDDQYVSLGKRCDIANQSKSRLFVSIHCNAAENHEANGIETFHYYTSTRGKLFANAIQRGLIALTDRRDRGVKAAGFQVLRDTSMPATLVELGFITNTEEEQLLQKEEFQNACAKAIVKGIDDFFDRGY